MVRMDLLTNKKLNYNRRLHEFHTPLLFCARLLTYHLLSIYTLKSISNIDLPFNCINNTMNQTGKSSSPQTKSTFKTFPSIAQECSWSNVKKRYVDTNVQQLRTYVPSINVDPKRNYILDSYKYLYSTTVFRISSFWNSLSHLQCIIFIAFTLIFLWIPVVAFSIFLFNASLIAFIFYGLFLDLSTLYAHTDATFTFATGHSLSQLPSLLIDCISRPFGLISHYSSKMRKVTVSYLTIMYEFIVDIVLIMWSYVPSTLQQDLIDLYAERIYPLGKKANQNVNKLTRKVWKYISLHSQASLQSKK